MPTQPDPTPVHAVRRLAACPICGARRRTLSDTTRGVKAHCMGCGSEISAPFATEADLSFAPPPPTGRLPRFARGGRLAAIPRVSPALGSPGRGGRSPTGRAQPRTAGHRKGPPRLAGAG
jgi:hypothetical protein